MWKHQIRWFYFRSLSHPITAKFAQNSCSLVHKSSRNSRDVEFDSFWNDANLEEMSKPVEECVNANLEEILNTCNVKITHLLNKHAPLRKSKKKVRPKRIWFSEELQVQRCIVRNKDSGGNICKIIYG